MPPEFSSAAHQHLLINHVPVIGLAFAVLSLGAALLVRSRAAQCIALALLCLSAGSVVAVKWTGGQAYNEMYDKLDSAGADWLDEHMTRADRAAPAFYVLAVLALAAALAPLRWPRSALPLGWIVVLLGVGCVGASAWIAKAGGQIRHPELRSGAAPAAQSPGGKH
jgi:hypothetical protein